MSCQTSTPLLPQSQLPSSKSTDKCQGNCNNCPNKHKPQGVSPC